MMPAFPMSGYVNHPALGRVPYQLHVLSDDPDQQVEATIGLMSEYALQDASNSIIKDESLAAASSGDPIEDTWRYLSRKDGARQMQFVHDEDTGRPWGDIGRWCPVVETLIRPVDQAVLSNPQGDCDDFSMYGAAHLLARGVPVSFCTVAADGSDPSIYSHVYLVAYPNGRRVPLDLSHGPYAGWETANRFGKRREWPIVPKSMGICKCILFAVGGVLLYKMLRGGLN